MKTIGPLVLVLSLQSVAFADEEAMSPLTAGPNGPSISERNLASKWWCRGMACVSSLPAQGDVCAELDPVNKGPCHGQDKAHVLRAFDVRQQAQVILVLTSASLCAGQLRRWKRDANLQTPTCEAATPAAFFGVDVSDKE
jgi:hypothetical protein